MIKNKILYLGVAVIALSGCETMNMSSIGGTSSQTRFVTAEIENEGKVEYVKVPIPVPKPYYQRIPDVKMVAAKKVSPEKAIRDARKSSLQMSTPDGFVNAMQVFDYMDGALYEIYSSPGYITSIVLQPGERIIGKATGNAKHWEMGETATGSGRDEKTVLILRPKKAGLKTNMMITTDRRIYMMEAKSLPKGVYNASVSWYYPQDEFKDLIKSSANKAQLEEQVVAGNVNLNDLNYNYDLNSVQGGEPDWMPIEAFDDGLKTYIRFNNELGTTKAPILYVMSEEGKAEIVNYRVRGNFYVIDRLIKVAELRLGKNSPKIVRITRNSKGAFFKNIFGKSKTRDDFQYN